jgi:predicted AlkP superfamily phosphohydrolase/phosphomutase
MTRHGPIPFVASLLRALPAAIATLALLAGAARAAEPAAASPNGAAQTPEPGRVIVLGFDGADARTVEKLMDAGQLPNLARLREQGTFAPLGTTNPAESPVAWASLNSGRNPAETAVPGFLMRDFDDAGVPFPIKGFQEDGVPTPVTELAAATPIPTWGRGALAFGIGLGAWIVFLFVFGVLLRLKRAPMLVLSALLALVGAWAGWTMRGYLPDEFPVTKNLNQATPFWEVAAKAGVVSRVIEGQQAWDREPVENAEVLCGLGVPDARGGYVSYFVYTTDELHFGKGLSHGTGSGGYKVSVEEVDGVIEGSVYGPQNFWERPALEARIAKLDEELAEPNLKYRRQAELESERDRLHERLEMPVTVPMRIEVARAGTEKGGETGAIELSIGAQTQTVELGGWSDWFRVTFELNPLLKVHAVTRARLVQLEPHVELFLNSVEVDPSKPSFWQPISQPADFAPELASEHGTFETAGWACLTHPLKDGIIDATTFLQDIEFTTRWREKLVYAGLARDDWRLFVGVFAEGDRVQHMMYHHYDPEHPLHVPAKAAQRVTFYGEDIPLSDAIPAVYRQIDRIVGKVMDEHLRPGDTLILCADHGFQSFRREVHLNNWLASEGYLAVKPGAGRAAMLGDYVDWSKTRAYALGLGTIYVNVRGGDAKLGIVEPADRDELCREIARKLLAAVDPDHPERKLVSSVDLVSEIHSGPFAHLEADLLVGFSADYRVSWSTSTGGMSLRDGTPGPAIVDNAKPWSGDHVSVDPRLVPGMFFCNREVELPAAGVDLLHVAPTALAALGVAVPDDIDVPALTLR